MASNLPRPLYVCRVQKPHAAINRIHSLLHLVALLALFYYRASFLYSTSGVNSNKIAWALVFASELHLSFIWLLRQPFGWRPMSRTVFPERLPGDDKLPPIDVFICTADPEKEPTVDVMNTLISAMSLDYPSSKLSVYLSDDAGSPLTLYAVREAWTFARSWVLFRRVYGIKTGCPEAYFSETMSECGLRSDQDTHFMEEVEKIRSKYEAFKDRLERARSDDRISYSEATSKQNHSPVIEVIHDRTMDAMGFNRDEMPLLVYVAREKRPHQPHNFKAGALNVLLRVSALLSNSPYILVLDCDMYCNDATSARQAMCFHLDPKLSQSLAFVQFPQRFRNTTKCDIYNSNLKDVFETMWPGLDGLQGPILSGTCFYIKRKIFYGNHAAGKDIDQLKQCFGSSIDFITSLRKSYTSNRIIDGDSFKRVIQETGILASCTYQEDTKWGKEIGFLYHSMVEDYFTGFILIHCKGWTSVYCNPSRPSFLGTTTTNLSDTLVQNTRWFSGLLQVCLSRFCPLTYGILRMPLPQCMCYAYFAFQPFYSFSLLCYATIPQLCLLNGIPLYPKVSDSWFIIFSVVYISSLCKNLSEVVLRIGRPPGEWLAEQRIWIIRSVTAYMFAFLDIIMKWIGMKGVAFVPTNKFVDQEQGKRYEMGIFDFQTSNVLLFVPFTTLTILNMASFVIGVAKVMVNGSYDQMFGQVFLSFYILIVSYPVIEGMVLRKDNGRIPTPLMLQSVAIAIVLLALGSSVLVMH